MRILPRAVFGWWKRDGGNGPTKRAEVPAQGKHPPLRDPPIDPWLAQLDREGIPRSLQYPTTNLGRILDQAAERFGDVPALVYNGMPWTYRELLARVNRTAAGLFRQGVREGDRVVLALPNCPEYVVSFFALQKLGALLVNVGPLLGADDLRLLFTLATPRLVIGLDLQAAKLIAAARDSSVAHFVWVTLQSYHTLAGRLGYQFKLWQGRPRVHTAAAVHTSFTKLSENALAAPPTIQPRPEVTAVLQPTSGTTGSLKLAQLSHRNLLANATQVAVCMGVRAGQERVLTLLPMFHVYGLTLGLINPVLCAATMIVMSRFEPAHTLKVLERHRPTVLPLVPAICEALSGEIEGGARPPMALSMRCLSGAAPLPIQVAERFERLTGARVIEGYGLTESSPVTHANPLSRPRYGWVGLPMPDTRCRIVELDDSERDVAPGQPGELLLAGPQIMSGYFGNPEETRRALQIDAQGRAWLRTGDVARMDADGFFQILDRKKDMIIRSGLKVYPGKVEKILRSHPRVVDAAVIGRTDPVRTEEVVAVIALSAPAGDRDALACELRDLCRAHLAPYEVPSVFEFVDQIPRSVLGKVLKKDLRRSAVPTTPEAVGAERRAA